MTFFRSQPTTPTTDFLRNELFNTAALRRRHEYTMSKRLLLGREGDSRLKLPLRPACPAVVTALSGALVFFTRICPTLSDYSSMGITATGARSVLAREAQKRPVSRAWGPYTNIMLLLTLLRIQF